MIICGLDKNIFIKKTGSFINYDFGDDEMVRQIEGKVVNRLRQVTSAIKQDGLNQVNIIKSKVDLC